MAATNKKKPYSLTPPHPQVVSIQPAPTGRALESESVYPTNGSNMGINMGINKKRPERRLFVDQLAERVGFEPTVDLHPRLISSQVHSTTLPPLRRVQLCGSIAMQLALHLGSRASF